MIRREVLLWIKAAEEDVEDGVEVFNRGRWFRVAFFSHQAVEKALKALFFIVRREDPPKIHSVTELYLLLRDAGFKLSKELEDSLYILNKYYTVTRYPDAANGLPSESVDRFEAERALEIAKRVLEEVRNYVRRYSGEG